MVAYNVNTIDVILVFANAFAPMLVTEAGIVTDVNIVAPYNAFSTIVVTPSGII